MKTEAELLNELASVPHGGKQWDVIQAQLVSVRHADMKPKPWYKQPATWIALGALIVSILGYCFPRH